MQESEILGYNNTPEPLLIVISGPSGVGKDAVLNELKHRHVPFHFVVTANTRDKRHDEVDGVDYIFVSKTEFAEMIDNDDLLEYAQVYDDYKGVPKKHVREALQSGKDVVMRLDVQGASTIHGIYPEALLIFLTTGSEQELVNRLMMRKTESEESLKIRIATAKKEFNHIEEEFDYIVVNRQGKLGKTVDTILSIIEAEHCRVHQRKIRL
ncbi:MAG: guanylate kinase [Anaerolineales bacterium]|nr:guanylate kinase [Anaerolineales bacterium]